MFLGHSLAMSACHANNLYIYFLGPSTYAASNINFVANYILYILFRVKKSSF